MTLTASSITGAGALPVLEPEQALVSSSAHNAELSIGLLPIGLVNFEKWRVNFIVNLGY